MPDEYYKSWDDRITCNGCCQLCFNPAPMNTPPMIDADFWVHATAEGEVCGQGNTGSVQVSAQGLIPLGVYTLWFVTDKGPYPAAPVRADYTADGYDPNRLIVNGNGILNYYIAPLDYNPFKGIPTPRGLAKIQKVILAFHTDRTTHGRSPGTPEVDLFDQLIAPLCYPRYEE